MKNSSRTASSLKIVRESVTRMNEDTTSMCSFDSFVRRPGARNLMAKLNWTSRVHLQWSRPGRSDSVYLMGMLIMMRWSGSAEVPRPCLHERSHETCTLGVVQNMTACTTNTVKSKMKNRVRRQHHGCHRLAISSSAYVQYVQWTAKMDHRGHFNKSLAHTERREHAITEKLLQDFAEEFYGTLAEECAGEDRKHAGNQRSLKRSSTKPSPGRKIELSWYTPGRKNKQVTMQRENVWTNTTGQCLCEQARCTYPSPCWKKKM